MNKKCVLAALLLVMVISAQSLAKVSDGKFLEMCENGNTQSVVKAVKAGRDRH